MKVAVLGAGSWGTALSIHLARGGHDVLLWGRDARVCEAIEERRLHPRRLKGIPIPAGVRVTSHLETRRFLSAAKGIEPETLKRMSEILLEVHPSAQVAALSGPTFAEGVALGDPSAAVVAGAGLARELQREVSSTLF